MNARLVSMRFHDGWTITQAQENKFNSMNTCSSKRDIRSWAVVITNHDYGR